MSPRVQLVVYPDGDPAFASHASIGLSLELPAVYTGDEVVAAIQGHLRVAYPLAAIHVTEASNADFDAAWHVYRDGLPAGGGGGE